MFTPMLASLLLPLLLLCRISFGQYSSNQCSWKGSGLTHESHPRDVGQVYLRCSQGSLEWLYPTGGIIVNLRPNTVSPAAARLSVCIKPSADSGGTNIYLDRNGKLRLLLREQDHAQGKVQCFSIQEGALFIEAVPHLDISRRITEFQYELVSDRLGPDAQSLEEIKLYKQVGDDTVLTPGPVSGTVTEISWKDGVNIAIEWDGTNIDSYAHFEVRGALNTATGEMTLRELTLDDSGLYTAEMNGVTSKYPTRLIVILPVPKPTVSKTCDEEMTKCTLTCDAIITNAEPVEYVWNSDHSVLTTPVLNITKDENSSTFECWLKNPVSQQHSEPFPNPFTPAGKLNMSAGLRVLIVLLVAVILTTIIHRMKAGTWFFEKDFWRNHERPQDAESNGAAAQEGLTEEGTPMKPNAGHDEA